MRQRWWAGEVDERQRARPEVDAELEADGVDQDLAVVDDVARVVLLICIRANCSMAASV